MIDQQLARLRTHRSNIQRYRNLLKTNLTELERQFVEKRLIEEQSNLECLAASHPQWLRAKGAAEEWPQVIRQQFLFGVFLMKYRGIEYAVIQEVDRGTWTWTVNLIDETAESGLRKSREGALTAVALTIDRWIARRGWR
jgi:hypothetical protein